MIVNKIISINQLIEIKNKIKRPIVFTNGVFDLLHAGHVTYLEKAKSLGCTLIVAINSDSSVKSLNKGPDRPINSEKYRAIVISALESVDYVIIFEESIPKILLQIIKPDIYVKGGDYDMKLIPESKIVKLWNGVSLSIPIEFEQSSSKIINKIRGLK